MATILNGPITIYRSHDTAAHIAAINNENDAEATYRAEAYADGYCIAVYVDGEFVIRL